MNKKTAVLVMHREGNSINKIVDSLNISRNTVRNIIRSNSTDHVPKKYKRSVQHYPALQDYIDDLDKMLKQDMDLPVKARRSCKKYYTQLETQEIYSNLVYGLKYNQLCFGGVFTAE